MLEDGSKNDWAILMTELEVKCDKMRQANLGLVKALENIRWHRNLGTRPSKYQLAIDAMVSKAIAEHGIKS